MVLGNCGNIFKKFRCNGCGLSIVGPAYSCVDCDFILHESCFGLPKEIQCPFHPLHSLEASQSRDFPVQCHLCRCVFRPSDVGYSCKFHSDFYFHYQCAISPRRPFKSSSHKHDLYYCGKDGSRMMSREWFYCRRCMESLSSFPGPFFGCLQCDTKFHLKCVPVPQIFKSKHHIHHLFLKDSFVEDD